MSQENVELVRRMIRGWNDRALRGVLSTAAADVAWRPAVASVIEGDTDRRGKDEVRQALLEIWSMWDQFELVETQVRETDEGAVWLGEAHVRGREGIELDNPFGFRVVATEGLITRLEAFLSWEQALEAAGLSE